MDSVWQRSINRWQKVLRMKRVWWNCCIEMDAAAKADLWVDRAGGARHHVDMPRAKTKNESLKSDICTCTTNASTKMLMKKTLILLLCSLTGLLACTAHATDIAGQWRAEFDTQIGTQKYVFKFQTDGDKLTGKAAAEVNDQKRETELKEGKSML